MRVNKGQETRQNKGDYRGDLGTMKIYTTDIQIETKNI